MKVIIILTSIVLFSCNASPAQKLSKDILSKDCFDNRRDMKIVENMAGEIIQFGEEYLISADPNQRFYPCNLPQKFKSIGTKIIFDGVIKEIFANERRAATPFVLKKIALKE